MTSSRATAPARREFPHLLLPPSPQAGGPGHRLFRAEKSAAPAGNGIWQGSGLLPPSILGRKRLDRAAAFLQARDGEERLRLLRGTEKSSADPETVRVLALRIDFQNDTPGAKSTGDGRFDLRSGDEVKNIRIDPPPHDRRYFDAHLQALARYYRSMTNGHLVLEWDVYPAGDSSAYHLPDTFKYGPWWFSNSNPDIFKHAIDLVGDALAAADSLDSSLDFSRYQRGPNKDISVILLHAGPDMQGDINQDSPWDIPSFNLAVAEPFWVQDSTVAINLVMVMPETVTQDGYTGALNGVVAHEFGHQLGFLDLYEVSAGIPIVGAFSLMDSGNDLVAVLADSTQPDGELAVHGALPASLDPWHKWQFFPEAVDWVVPQDSLRADSSGFTASLSAVEATNRVLFQPLNVTEDLLAENRHWDLNGDGETPVLKRDPSTGVILGPAPLDSLASAEDLGYREYDHLLPGQGVLLWHIDWRALYAGLSLDYGGVNSFYSRPGVGVYEADGIRDIGSASEEYLGGPLDPYYRGGFECLGPETIPNSNSNDGTPTGLTLCVPDSIGFNMRVRLDLGRVTGMSPLTLRGEPGDDQFLALDMDGDQDLEMVLASKDSLLVLTYEGHRLTALPTGRVSGALAGRSDFLRGAREGEVAPLVAGVSDGILRLIPGTGPMLSWPSADSAQVADSLVSSAPVVLRDMVLVGCRDGYVRGIRPGVDAPVVVRTLVAQGEVSMIGAGPLSSEDAAPTVLWATRQGEMGHFHLGESVPADSVHWRRTAGSIEGQIPVTILAAPAGASGTTGQDLFLSLWKDGTLEWRTADGRLLNGWPVALGIRPAGEAILCDLDADGVLETVVAGQDGRVHALGWNGVEKLHWPRRIWSEDDLSPPEQETGPRAIDLDGDGKLELLILRADGILLVLDGAGQVRNEWDFSSGSAGSSGPHWIPPGRTHGARLAMGSVLAADVSGTTKTALTVLRVPQALGEGIGLFPVIGCDQARSRTYPPSWVPQPQGASRDFVEKSLRLYPNPLRRGDLTVHFVLGKPAQIQLEAFDLTGRRMASLEVQGTAGAGGNQIAWNLASLAPGLYHIRLRVNGDGFHQELFEKLAVLR